LALLGSAGIPFLIYARLPKAHVISGDIAAAVAAPDVVFGVLDLAEVADDEVVDAGLTRLVQVR
jgi:hypothetical protein